MPLANRSYNFATVARVIGKRTGGLDVWILALRREYECSLFFIPCNSSLDLVRRRFLKWGAAKATLYRFLFYELRAHRAFLNSGQDRQDDVEALIAVN